MNVYYMFHTTTHTKPQMSTLWGRKGKDKEPKVTKVHPWGSIYTSVKNVMATYVVILF